MRGMRDVADFTSNLVEWAAKLLPDIAIEAATSREGGPEGGDRKDRILVRLASIESQNGRRSREVISHRLKLEYRFELLIADPAAEHQAMADLAFGLLERPDMADGNAPVRGHGAVIAADFMIDRSRDLPRAKPVREAVIDIHPQARVAGFVRAENGFPLARAQLQVRGSDRLIVTDNDGAFAFAAPEGLPVSATVSAKGRIADVELRPGDPNVITLAMET